jgi:predicted membrane channel-forming protein YqfA (hemolysin III family)
MRKSFKLMLTAAGCSVVAEMLVWLLTLVTARTASEGVIFRMCAGFHWAPDAIRYFLFHGIENHPAIVDNMAMMTAFFAAALLQWFCLFMGGFVLLQPLYIYVKRGPLKSESC